MKKTFIPKENTLFFEIFQAHEIKFAFVKETPQNYIQQHGFVKCRDFLADVLHAEYANKKVDIYKFIWDPEKDKIDRDATKLVMKFEYPEQLKELKNNLSLLHAYESSWKLRKTKILTVDEKTAIIIGSSFYLKKGFAISLYTYLLKVFSLTNDFNNLTNNEQKYYELCGENFQKLIKNFRKLLAYKTSVSGVTWSDMATIHNYAGFVAVCCYPDYQVHGKYLDRL